VERVCVYSYVCVLISVSGITLDSIEVSGIEVEARRLAIEAIAKLVYIKKTCASELLAKCGVPEQSRKSFLTSLDPTTGGKRSKRDAGVAMLDELRDRGLEGPVIRKLVRVVADWDAFHLAQNEYEARAVVQKARRMVGALEEFDERERRIAEAAVAEAAKRQAEIKNRDRIQISEQLKLLLAQFDHASLNENSQERGYLLEDLFNRLFDLLGFPVVGSFKRNNGGEQIDGAFEMDGWHYVVECRWREKLSDIRQLDGLYGQVARSGRQTMGVFLSINGWSVNVPQLLRQNPEKNIFLMEGFDIRSVLEERVNLRDLLKKKLSALNLNSQPYLSVMDAIAGRH